MAKRGLRHRMVRLGVCFALGGSVFQLSGCDPAVRDTLLAGLQATSSTLMNTLIDAFFTSLADDDGDGGLSEG